MRILVLYNVARELKKGESADLICEQEITIIVPFVTETLAARGYRVDTLETTFDLWEQLKARRGLIDLVFNLAEAFGGTNTHETLVPAMLEVLDMPFTGATGHNMHLTLDKEKTKLVLGAYGIPVPKHQVFRSKQEEIKTDLKFPLMVKPIREEASIGIHHDSVVMSEEDLHTALTAVLEKYKQPALVEEFIIGREISVGVIGNPPNLTVFPPLEFLFPDVASPLEQIRSYEYKWGGKKEQMVRSGLPEDMVTRLADYTRTAHVATECRDYARMDYRIDEGGNAYLLEVNYNPGIGPNTHGLNNTFTMMASFMGFSFEDLVEQIVLIAARRYGTV